MKSRSTATLCREGSGGAGAQRDKTSAFPSRRKGQEQPRAHRGLARAISTSRASERWQRDSKAPAAAAGSLISISGNRLENQTPSVRNLSPDLKIRSLDPMLKEQRSRQAPGRPCKPGAERPRRPIPSAFAPCPPPAPWEQRQHPEGWRLIFSWGKAGAREQPSARRFYRCSECLGPQPTPLPPGLRIQPPPGISNPSPDTNLPLPGEEEEDAGTSPGAGGCHGPTADLAYLRLLNRRR